MKWPFAFIGKPHRTLVEHKIAAWSDLVPAYKVTCPVETRKQWKPIIKFKRSAS